MTAKTIDDIPEGAPPPYECATSDTHSQDMTVIQIQRKPGKAAGGKFYYDHESLPSVQLLFYPEPSGYATAVDEQPWFAQMFVKCDDVPRLMREGFHWTAANVLKEEGCVIKDKTKQDEARNASNQVHFMPNLLLDRFATAATVNF